MQRTDILIKGTNLFEKLFECAVKSIIPIALAVIIATGGYESLLKETSTSNEQSVVNGDTIMGETDNTEPVFSSLEAQLPQDIQKLVDNAKAQYSTLSNDGAIIKVDYSTQNATSQYDGVYIRNTTLNHQINIEEYLNKSVFANIDKSKPSVLIYHTHTSEAYELVDSAYYSNKRSTRSENQIETVVRAGEEICKILEENGYITIHDKTVYDTSLSGAYDRSRENVSKILKENPSIQIALDIHRDSIQQKDGSRIKPVTESDGKKVAQIMLITGCEDGNVTGFPNWQKNLTFALQLQEKLTKDNKGLTRPLMICSRKYNMDLIPCAISVEIGTEANTITEAIYSAQLFAHSLSQFLEDY